MGSTPLHILLRHLHRQTEKKYSVAYISFLKQHLENNLRRELETQPEMRREMIRQRFIGREEELSKLYSVLSLKGVERDVEEVLPGDIIVAHIDSTITFKIYECDDK